MKKIGNLTISNIDEYDDFEIELDDCDCCGRGQYFYINKEQAHELMYFIKKEITKNEKTI